MVDVFVSYAREDEGRAETLKKLLDAEGWNVWWDQEIRIGRPWGSEIERALDQAKAVVVLWTKAATESEWVTKEADHALEYGKLFGVLLEPCQVPNRFTELEMAILEGWKGASDASELAQLLRSLAERIPPSRIDTVRPGFDSRFLGEDHRIGWPAVHGAARQLHYLHFSVVMNPARRLPWYVAYNMDSNRRRKEVERRSKWMPDPLISEEFQPGDQHFRNSGLDRGTLAAFSTVNWGDEREAWIAGHQAFFWTNTTPQHLNVNRISYLSVERWERQVAARHGRLVGFCGPIFRDDDPSFRDEEEGDDGFVAYETFRIPMAYWKVVVVLDHQDNFVHRAFRFDNGLPDCPKLNKLAQSHEARNPAQYKVELTALAKETSLEFPSVLLEAQPCPDQASLRRK